MEEPLYTSNVSSTGCQSDVAVNSLLPYTLPVNNFSIFKADSGKNHAVSTSRGKQRKKQQQHIPSPISGQSKIHAYLTVTKTVLKTEDKAHIEHQNIPQTSRVFPRDLCLKHQNHGKQKVIHSSAKATKKHIPNCDQGSKGPGLNL